MQLIQSFKYSAKTLHTFDGEDKFKERKKRLEDQYFIKKNRDAIKKIKKQMQAEICNNIVKKNESEQKIRQIEAEMHELELEEQRLDQKYNSDGSLKTK